MPLGKIMLALSTAELSGLDYTEYLDGDTSWGQIWQELDLKGKPGHGEAPGQIKQGGDSAPDGSGQNAPLDPPGNK